MATRKRFKLKKQQKNKRQKRRHKLTEKGLDPAQYFYGKYYLR